LDEDAEKLKIDDWAVNPSQWKTEGTNPVCLSSNRGTFFFNVKQLSKEGLSIQVSQETDLFVKFQNNQVLIHSIGTGEKRVTVSQGEKKNEVTRTMTPGEIWALDLG
jgi:hypothetical protein